MRKQDLLAGLFIRKDRSPDNQPKTEKILFYLLLIISFFTVVIIYFKSDSPYDTGDGIVHYQIARYSWKYPQLLLDLWGKPFFTLISSPFAQFGIKGMYVFQALNAAVISWFLFDIASKINLKYVWTIPAFVFFAPVYFAVMNSGLVEISFGMMFMFSVWLVFNKKYYASSMVASLLPFVRPEAYVVMPLLIVIYIYRKQFIAIPLLLSGSVIYSIIGYFHFKDILWVINRNYQLAGDNYAGNKGSYFHYFELYDQIWGTVYTILLILGIGVILWQGYKLFRRKPEHEYVEEVFVLFLGSTIGSFILHTLLFGMPGILNNLGMLRYLAVLIPGSAFIALVGLNIINSSLFFKVRFLRPLLVVTVIILVVRSSFAQWYYPFEPYNQQYVIRQMAVYIKTDWPEFKKICFLHPLLPALADLDPYDSQKVQTLWSTDPETLNQLPDSTLLLWDSHFMKSDGKISFQWLSENPNFTLLKHYRFSNEELPFEACLFIRTDNATPIPVPVEIVSPKGMISESLIQETITHTFENDPANFQQWIAKLKYFSGRSTLEFTPNMEFGPTFLIKIGDINKNSALKSVTLKYNLFQSDTIKNMVSVVEIKDKNKQISWEGLVIKQPLEANKWNAIELQHSFPELLNDETLNVNVYIWNKDKQNFYIDDFEVSFESVKSKHR
jgi:hypothetical protein